MVLMPRKMWEPGLDIRFLKWLVELIHELSLSGGYTTSGSDGVILPKTVSISAKQRSMMVQSDLLGYVAEAGVALETLRATTTTVNSKDVATSNKFIDSITLADATDGSRRTGSNYQLYSLDAANAPVVISAKTVGLSASRI